MNRTQLQTAVSTIVLMIIVALIFSLPMVAYPIITITNRRICDLWLNTSEKIKQADGKC